MERWWFILLFLVLLSFFVSADIFSIASSGHGEFSIGGITGQQVGGFSGNIPPAPSSPASPIAPGGGGPMILPPIENLIINPTSFNLPASAGIKSSGEIFLKNVGHSSLNITINLVNPENILSFGIKNFVIKASESRFLGFNITAPNKAGIYTGKIIFSIPNEQTIIPFAVNVGEGQSLFDISLDTSTNILAGKNLTAQIKLTQMGVKQQTDVTLKYIIKDFEEKIYSQNTETIAVFDQKTFQKQFDTSSLGAGDYVLGIEAIYSGGIATASSKFSITNQSIAPEIQIPKISLVQYLEMLIGLMILMFIIFLIILIRRKRIWKA